MAQGWFAPEMELMPSGRRMILPPERMMRSIWRMEFGCFVKFFLGTVCICVSTPWRWLRKNSL